MKKIFVVSLLLLSVLAVNAAELFYNNGTSVSIQKAEDMYAVKSDASKSEGRKDALYRLNTGLEVYSFVSGTEKRGGDELPVYFLGDMPVVAERTVFWRGEKSVEYMEKQSDMKLDEIFPTYPLYAFSVKGDSVEMSEKIVKNGDGYAFPNFVREADRQETVVNFVPESEPKDPYFDVQWHLQNTGTAKYHYANGDFDGPVVANADVKFVQMLNFLHSNNIEVNTNTKIAIMDSGVKRHEDLKITEKGYNALKDEESADAADPREDLITDENSLSTIAHGTHCAGVSAGAGNETGMSGVCPWCWIYPVRYKINGTYEAGDVTIATSASSQEARGRFPPCTGRARAS